METSSKDNSTVARPGALQRIRALAPERLLRSKIEDIENFLAFAANSECMRTVRKHYVRDVLRAEFSLFQQLSDRVSEPQHPTDVVENIRGIVRIHYKGWALGLDHPESIVACLERQVIAFCESLDDVSDTAEIEINEEMANLRSYLPEELAMIVNKIVKNSEKEEKASQNLGKEVQESGATEEYRLLNEESSEDTSAGDGVVEIQGGQERPPEGSSSDDLNTNNSGTESPRQKRGVKRPVSALSSDSSVADGGDASPTPPAKRRNTGQRKVRFALDHDTDDDTNNGSAQAPPTPITPNPCYDINIPLPHSLHLANSGTLRTPKRSRIQSHRPSNRFRTGKSTPFMYSNSSPSDISHPQRLITPRRTGRKKDAAHFTIYEDGYRRTIWPTPPSSPDYPPSPGKENKPQRAIDEGLPAFDRDAENRGNEVLGGIAF